jgi:AcrR family transcriptional regulator
VELLAEVGYARLTVEGISKRSGVPKTTIYRWWKNKSYVVYEATATTATSPSFTPTGDGRFDIEALLRRMFEERLTPVARAASPGLIADFEHDEAGWERFVAEYLRPQHEQIRRVFDEARAAALVPPDLDVDAVSALIFSATFGYSVLYGRFPTSTLDATRVATTFADLILAPSGGTPKPSARRRARPR